MLRHVVCVALALLIFVGGLLAAEGTIVKIEKGKLTVKVGDKEQEIALKGVKVTKDGVDVPGKERREALKKDAKVEIVEKDGKVVEIKIK
jgi:hypothetical protein